MNRRNFLGLVAVVPIVTNKDFDTKEERHIEDDENTGAGAVSTEKYNFRDLVSTVRGEDLHFVIYKKPLERK